MKDYNYLRNFCEKDSKLAATVIDDFLIYYAAGRDKFDKEFHKKVSPFKHLYKEFPSNWMAVAIAQYIAFRIFKKDGLIHKYLKHSAVRELGESEQAYLQKKADSPWRFSFSRIIQSPAPDFYEMEDVFSGQFYLLHSPSVTNLLSQKPAILWFNLIGFNGECWQTFGPLMPISGFDEDDIFFFATELDETVESDVDLMEHLEDNPLPYMMLFGGSAYPLVVSSGFEIVQVTSETYCGGFELESLRKSFKIEYAHNIFKISHENLSIFPHNAEAYFDEENETLLLTALTDYGYAEMAMALNQYGFDLPRDPEIRVHFSMLRFIDTLLKREIVLNPYSKLFEVESSKESNDDVDGINKFMELALPFINSDEEFDVEALAKQASVDPSTAREFLNIAMARMRELRK